MVGFCFVFFGVKWLVLFDHVFLNERAVSQVNIIKIEEQTNCILLIIKSYTNPRIDNSNIYRGQVGKVTPTVSLRNYGELESVCPT